MRLLIEEYQKGSPSAGHHQFFSVLFLVLFTPAVVRIYSRSRKVALSLDPKELLNQICLFLLETLQGLETAQTQERVASRIMGRVKNLLRAWMERRIKEEGRREEYLPRTVIELEARD